MEERLFLIHELFMALHQSDNGYITLLSVLIVSAIGLSVSLSLLSLGGGATQITDVWQKQFQAKNYSESCVEIAISELLLNGGAPSTGGITFSDGSCSYSVAADVSNWEIQSTGMAGSVVRRVRAVVDLTGMESVIVSWQEISSF